MREPFLVWAVGIYGSPCLFVPANAADERLPGARWAVTPPRVTQMSGALPGGGHDVPCVRAARRAPDLAMPDWLTLPIGWEARIDRGASAVLKQDRIQLRPPLVIGEHDEPDPRGGRAGHTLTVRGDGFDPTALSGRRPNTTARESSMMIIVGRSLSTG